MDLTLILGPMKSGKSHELIGFFSPLKYTNLKFELYQSKRNLRDESVESRNGTKLQAKKIKSLFEILKTEPKEIVGIDEVNMFPEKDSAAVREILNNGTRVIASGLDMDYRGHLFPIIARLLELGPKEIKYKRAVCDICRSPDAIYTQILKGKNPILSGLPSVVPDDGTYLYQAACRKCFIKTE